MDYWVQVFGISGGAITVFAAVIKALVFFHKQEGLHNELDKSRFGLCFNRTGNVVFATCFLLCLALVVLQMIIKPTFGVLIFLLPAGICLYYLIKSLKDSVKSCSKIDHIKNLIQREKERIRKEKLYAQLY
jgi:hypothetical protein